MPIRILSSDLSSQISAGEVIDRPASVIKEIIENSIDANAKNINIEIEQNGFKSIFLNDDGFGIDQKELLLAITRHATSKINSLSDLDSINTFGFRGEALASIKAVSRFTLISSNRPNNVAWKIYSEGFIDSKIVLQPIAHPQGTTVLVENLFYNIPVKLKFIQNQKLEFLKIFEVIKKIALSHFHINFSLKHNKKIIVQYNALKNSNNKIDRLKDVFLNKININELLEIKSKIYNIMLFGWISYPRYFNNLKKIQYCYVNNRYIRNNLIVNAVCSAYKEIVGNKYVSFVLYLTVPSNEIDINIHPTKNEIVFNKFDIIYTFIYNSILHNLKKNQNKYLLKITSLSFSKKNIKKKEKNITFDSFFKKYDCSFQRLLIVVRKYYGLIHQYDNFSLISFPLAQAIIKKYQLKIDIKEKKIPKYFLANIKINLIFKEYSILLNHQEELLLFGFYLIFKKNYVILKFIPVCFMNKNIDITISKFFKFLFVKRRVSISDIINWFYINLFIELKNWNYTDGISVLLQMQYYCPFLLKNPPPRLLQKININSALCMLKI
ncbi:DNA mismatch repair endonuclease MutL [Buchnera aphidicola (Brevicoryne brassicae)]|uniref:DNA mismatch repair endonuclease MutL n=1 Tax=Buchnera aphidicola TaxID=9 RepID=UPI0010C2ADE1|nr:DNA mismatch repair endonuclease MutL [Buchnera aphidicola]QCI20108.1 DNA mismatch repair endonuclease MutL [Buchnera aphidicola (Brevicoryne brassicae)]